MLNDKACYEYTSQQHTKYILFHNDIAKVLLKFLSFGYNANSYNIIIHFYFLCVDGVELYRFRCVQENVGFIG